MKLFTKHPESIGETYWQHCYAACIMGGKMMIGGIACILHAFFPFTFEKTASNILIRLIHEFIDRSKTAEPRITTIAEHVNRKWS